MIHRYKTLVLDYAYHLAASDITSQQQQQQSLKVPILWKESKVTKSECINHFWEKKWGLDFFGLFCFSAFLKNATALLVQVQDKNKTVKLIR